MPSTADPVTPEAAAQLVALRFHAHDPRSLARFWAEALHWNIDGTDPAAIRLVPTDATSFPILFRAVADRKVGQNRQHFDLTTTSMADQNETVARLIELGARHIDIGQTPDEGHVVLADPEGNELCIIEPTNNFLADCERLGAVNCDGTRAVGHFWCGVLGWPLVWDQDEETAIRAPDRTGPMITWSGPPLMPKLARSRLHFEIAPPDDVGHQELVERLISLGASRVDLGQGEIDQIVMADPDGEEFCVVAPQSLDSLASEMPAGHMSRLRSHGPERSS